MTTNGVHAPRTVADVVAEWRKEGPLVHEPTGIDELDARTGGGPVYGTRWYVLGAPDAGKTALLVQLADEWAARGLAVGYLAVDEEPTDLTTRLAQRAGYHRRDCEERDHGVLDGIAERVSGVWMYDATWTIESAAKDLATRGKRRALFVDSIQTVECDLERGPDDQLPRSIREAVVARTKALRHVATSHRLIAIAASEMNRGGYRTRKDADEANDLATGKESGAIEYSGRVLLALRSVPAEVAEDMVECRVAKNKHGPIGAVPIYLKLDRAHMALTQCEAPELPEKEGSSGPSHEDLIALQRVVLSHPGMGTNQLRKRARLADVASSTAKIDLLVQAALDGGYLEDRPIPRGKVTDHHYHATSTHMPEGNAE